MRRFAIWGINLYQKYISPYKGYRCAYGVYHQNGTCSSIIKGHIQKEGVIKAYPLIKQQFVNCKDAYELLMIQREEQKKRKKQKEERLKREKKEEGSCSGDCGGGCSPPGDCSGADCSSCSDLGGCGDFAGVCDCAGGVGSC